MEEKKIRGSIKTSEERKEDNLKYLTAIVNNLQRQEEHIIIADFLEKHSLNEFEGKNGAKMILIAINEDESRAYEYTRKGWWENK